MTTPITSIRGSIATPTVLTSSFVAASVCVVQRTAAGMTLACKYTRATGVAGVPQARIEWSADGINYFFDGVLNTTITPSAPFGQQQAYLTDIPMPVPSSDVAILFLLPIVVIPPGAQYMRASFKDGGMTPGTLGVEVWSGPTPLFVA